MNTKQKAIAALAERCTRLIEWSRADGCYVGSAPPLVGQCCHGKSTIEVATQLEEIVLDLCEDAVDGKIPVPEAMDAKPYSGKFVVRVSPALHKTAALKAQAREESLNKFVANAIANA